VNLNLNETSIQDNLGDIVIKLDSGYSINGSETIFATIEGNSLPYDDLVYITASNEVGATTPQSFNVFVNYTIPDLTLPEYSTPFVNIGLEYNDVENINLNNVYNFYDYIILSIGAEEITVYLNGTNDYGNITTSNYNISLENIGTFISLTLLSESTDEDITINVQACNVNGCDSERTFTLSISEEGVPLSSVPSWFPNPPEDEKIYYAIGIMTIFIIGIAIIGANDNEGLSKGLVSFGLIGLFALFLFFSLIGWIPIWVLILLIIVVVGYVSFMIKGAIGGN
jgi:hypothetical protein